jgi:hypothetical protein
VLPKAFRQAGWDVVSVVSVWPTVTTALFVADAGLIKASDPFTASFALVEINFNLLFTGNHVVSPPLAQTCSPIPRPHIFWK